MCYQGTLGIFGFALNIDQTNNQTTFCEMNFFLKKKVYQDIEFYFVDKILDRNDLVDYTKAKDVDDDIRNGPFYRDIS